MKLGKNNGEISRIMEIPPSTLRGWRKEVGLQPAVEQRRLSSELKQEIIIQIEEGQNDAQISRNLGISTASIRRLRKENNLPPSSGNKVYTIDQLNDVIDLIRAEFTLTEISQKTGMSSARIRQLHREEIREGNLLPEIKKEKSVTQKYSDEELIELAFINPGYGFDRFTKFLGVRRNFVMDLFLQFKEFTGGEEDPFGCLQDPSNHTLVSEHEYKQITGRKYMPRGMGRPTAKRAQGENKGKHLKIQLPPQEFNWGEYSQKMWHVEKHPAHELKGDMSVSEWIENKISEKGYVRFEEDSADFSESTGAGASKGSFRKWMKRSNLQYNAGYQYWTR